MSKEQCALLLLGLSIGLALAVDICEYQMNGARLSHPADCNKFVECQNGKTYRILSCPLGLHFNRFKGTCDLRQRAACDIAFVNFLNEATNCSACCELYGCYVRPECPETPGTPTTVISSSTPSMPETPTTMESTENPSTPPTPDITNIPGTASPPASPDTPDTSATISTEIPSSPITPVSPEIPASTFPDTPATPGHSPSPETPSSPTTAASPETPASTFPDTPATPGHSPSPETPSSPITPVSPEIPTSTSSPETPSPETPVTPDTPQTTQCANNLTVCQNELDNSTLHVNGTCNRYIVCVAGCAYIMSCPANLQYDIARRVCDYPQNVECPWQSTTSVTGPSGVTCAHHGQCENQIDGKMFANSNSDGYIICQCECEIERPCPPGTKFDAELATCAWKANKTYESDGKTGIVSAACQNNIEICRNQTEGKLFPVNGVCNKFYKCNFGCAIETICPNNLIYNPQAEYCDYPYNYKCPWPFTAPSGPSAGPSGIACASGGRCVGKKDGTLFPSWTSCAKFIVCQCECEVERECAKNLYWDTNLLTCNYLSNVTCELN